MITRPSESKPWYCEDSGLWDQSYLDRYRSSLTPKHTKADVDFLERELRLTAGMQILDLCCGHGRHTIELAKRSYQMTGIDLNNFFLDQARRNVQRAGVAIGFFKRDMRDIPFRNFDVVLSLFTSFGYLENDKEDQQVLHQIAAALKPGGRFVLDVINYYYIIREFQPLLSNRSSITRRTFDFESSRIHESYVQLSHSGKPTNDVVQLSLRLYPLHELIRMFYTAGLEYLASFGGNNSIPIDLNSPRCIIIAQKP